MTRLALMSMCLLAGVAQAATSPEQLTTEYFAALKKDGMAAVASYIHPDELARFKQMLLPVFQREAANNEHAITEGLFGKGTRLAQVEAMSGLDFMTGVMRVVGEKLQDVSFDEVQVLGTVRENEVAHVVARVSAEASELKIKTLDVISAKPFGKEWKLLLTGELEGLAAALAKQ